MTKSAAGQLCVTHLGNGKGDRLFVGQHNKCATGNRQWVRIRIPVGRVDLNYPLPRDWGENANLFSHELVLDTLYLLWRDLNISANSLNG